MSDHAPLTTEQRAAGAKCSFCDGPAIGRYAFGKRFHDYCFDHFRVSSRRNRGKTYSTAGEYDGQWGGEESHA
jgi:hypothetical protein